MKSSFRWLDWLQRERGIHSNIVNDAKMRLDSCSKGTIGYHAPTASILECVTTKAMTSEEFCC